MCLWYLKQSSINSFPGGQFFIEGYNTPLRFDRNWNGGGILLYVRDDIQAEVILLWFSNIWELLCWNQSFIRKKWLLNCSYNPQKNNINNHLDVITNTLDTYYGKYKNVIFPMKSFWKSFDLTSLIKQPICFKDPERRSWLIWY